MNTKLRDILVKFVEGIELKKKSICRIYNDSIFFSFLPCCPKKIAVQFAKGLIYKYFR
ncbi:hypothetical protein LguiA_002040 [Lonicera macranthoides]